MSPTGEPGTSGITGHPPAEVDVTAGLVRSLLADQHPDLVDQPLVEAGAGWDNAVFRLGDDLVVRLPRRALAAPLVEHEQRWLPELARGLPLPVPAPVRVGSPAPGYPWSWSICPWLDGRSLLDDDGIDPGAAAEALGGFLAALHRPAPPDAPSNPFRGVALAARREVFRSRLEALEGRLDAHAATEVFEAGATAEPASAADAHLWIHGDLHPDNVLVDHGRISAVIDFGDLCAGDRASDLAAAWMLFEDPGERARLRRHAGLARPIDDATWCRARGWAVQLAVAFLASSADSPAYAGLAVRTLERAVAET